MVRISLRTNASGFRMFELFESPGRGIQSAPSVATGRKPRPPITDVLEAARRKQAALEFVTVFRACCFTNDPISASQDSWGGLAQPGVVAGETVMLGQHPKNPPV